MLQSLGHTGVTHYIGCIGEDENGKILNQAASGAGVKTHYNISKKSGTGRCAVLVADRERSLVADLGAANDYDHAHFLSTEIQEVVANCDIYYSSSFFLTVSPQTSIQIGKYSLEHNKLFVINIAATFICSFFWEPLSEVVKYADIVIGNEDEAAAFAEKAGWDKSNLNETAIKLQALPTAGKPRTVIFTQGKNPTIVCRNGEIELIPVNKIDPSLIVDTNGAGDSFVAGLLTGLSLGYSLNESVLAGHYLASEVIQQDGATFPAKLSFAFPK